MGWLNWWSRRKLIAINGTAVGSQTNYQMKLIVYYGTGSDSVGNIYCNSQVRSDFGDMRFTSSDGLTLLNYWIETYISGSIATVWIQIPSIPYPGTTSIYIYYNNPSATDTGNAHNTFLFFDDFNDGTYNGTRCCGYPVWTQDNTCTFNGGSITVVDDSPQIKALRVTRTNASCGSGVTAPFTYAYGAWHVKLKKTAGTDGNGIFFWTNYGGNWSYYLFVTSNGVALYRYGGAQIGSTYAQAIGSWHTYDITRDQNGSWKVYIDGSGTPAISGTDNNGTTSAKIAVNTNSWSGSTSDFADDIYIRKFVSPEPAWSSIGSEEWLNSFLMAGD